MSRSGRKEFSIHIPSVNVLAPSRVAARMLMMALQFVLQLEVHILLYSAVPVC